MNLTTLLIPVDFSDCSNNAVNLALQLAQKTGAHIHFVHSVETVVDWNNIEFMTTSAQVLPSNQKEDLFPEVKESIRKAREQLNQIAKKASSVQVECTVHLCFNIAHKDIVELAHRLEVDLVVMGTHGASGLKELLMGSNTQQVIRLAKCPVLSVKSMDTDFSIKNLIYASDFDEKNVNQNLMRAKEFAQLFDARLHLLFVNTPGYFEESGKSQAKMEKQAHKFGLEDYTINVYNDFTVEWGIGAFAAQLDTPIIAISIHGYRGLKRILNNNVTESVVNHLDRPILSLNTL